MSPAGRVARRPEKVADPRPGHAPTAPTPGRPEPPPGRSRLGLPAAGVVVLVALVLLSLHLAARLRDTLETELNERLRIAAVEARDLLRRDPWTGDDTRLLVPLDAIRRSTRVSGIVLYDTGGERIGERREGGVPRKIRLPAARGGPVDPWRRAPENDAAGGRTFVLPAAPETGVGAVLTRIDREGLKGLATVDLLFQFAQLLGLALAACGVLVLLRRSGRGGADPAVPAHLRSDVGVVLDTMTEVVTTLKDSESEYRDRWTAAQRNAERYRATNDLILSSITSGVIAFDAAGRITTLNPAAEEILDVPARFAVGRSVREVFGAADRMARLAAEVVERGRTASRIEVERTGEAGETVWIGISSSVIRGDDGSVAGGIFLLTDLTETRRLREQAGLGDRLAAVGEMSAGIAHEIKNALHSILGFANLLRDDHDARPPLAVSGILSEVGSLEELVQGVLEFSRPSTLARVPASVADVVRDTEPGLSEAAARAGVRIVTEVVPGLPDASIDVAAVRRVFLNLGLNAIEAMPDGGTLTIGARLAEAQGEGDDERAIRVSFRDDGPGIAEADRARIFTPFHTTKREGSGLGLALVHRTVTDHGGRIQLHSRVGVGSEFVVFLPVEG